MRTSRGPLRRGLTLLCIATLAAGAAGTAYASPARIVRGTLAAGDPVLDAPSGLAQAFSRARYWRVSAFTPYFDGRLSYTAGAWAHQSAFALDAADATANPSWVLHDVYGNQLYLGAGRYAADFGNAAFRAWWITRAQARLALGYRGVFVDDVLMERRTTTAGGALRNPIDPRTGWTMSEASWQGYMADFMGAVRVALPGAEIVHDVIWHKGDANGALRRQLDAATVISVRGAFNDPIVVAGTGRYGWQSLAGYVERQQARGIGVLLDGAATTPAARLYGRANQLLVDGGWTAIANDAATAPGAFWTGYDLDLGAPAGPRTWTGAVWRRDFARGLVLVNEPGRPAQTVALPAAHRDLDGVARESVTLPGGSAAILVPAPTPPPTPTPEPPTSTNEPAPGPTPVPPRRRTPRTSGSGDRATAAGAAPAGGTRLAISGSRARVSGKVTGARGGYVRFVVERSRGGRWSAAVRGKSTVRSGGRFATEFKRLRKGRYRVRGTFEGTGTALPSRSENRPFRVG